MTTDLSSSRHDRSAGEEDWEWVEWTCAASTQVSGGGEWCAGSVVLPDVSKLRASDRQATCGQSRGRRGLPRTLASHAVEVRRGGRRGNQAAGYRRTTSAYRPMTMYASIAKKLTRIRSIGALAALLEVHLDAGWMVPDGRKMNIAQRTSFYVTFSSRQGFSDG